MFMDETTIAGAAQLIESGLETLPIEDHAEFLGLDEAEARAFIDLFDELTWSDLVDAVRAAANRLPEPRDEDVDDTH